MLLQGAGKAATAITSSRVVVILGTSFMAVCGAVIYFTRHQLGQLFTAGDPAVLAAIAAIAPLGAAYQVKSADDLQRLSVRLLGLWAGATGVSHMRHC